MATFLFQSQISLSCLNIILGLWWKGFLPSTKLPSENILLFESRWVDSYCCGQIGPDCFTCRKGRRFKKEEKRLTCTGMLIACECARTYEKETETVRQRPTGRHGEK